MNKSIIEVRNIGKKYNITHTKGGYVALRDVITNIFKNPFAFFKAKVRQAAGFERQEEFWALKDIDFKVEKGEVVGIIGSNGAGKSTLLKILSQITPPTTGEIILRGRVGSLLEVGTGFHPELTGRENIFLNGAILGMKKKEIEKKFDEIVKFAGIERFLDTPVKHYSSGMYVRLAFSVAAHMDPDILLIDEVLAVGDIEFQKKCLGKMDDITKKEGRTIIFVSHNMAAMEQLCSRVILLKNGRISNIGPTKKIIADYIRESTSAENKEIKLAKDTHKEISFTKIWITNDKNEKTNNISVSDNFKIWLDFYSRENVEKAEISLVFKNTKGVNVLFTSLSDSFNKKFQIFKTGDHTTNVSIDKQFLMPDTYTVTAIAHFRGIKTIDIASDVLSFNINEDGTSTMAPYAEGGKYWGAVLGNSKWNIDTN